LRILQFNMIKNYIIIIITVLIIIILVTILIVISNLITSNVEYILYILYKKKLKIKSLKV